MTKQTPLTPYTTRNQDIAIVLALFALLLAFAIVRNYS